MGSDRQQTPTAPTYDPNELVSPATIAERKRVSILTVYGWRRRGHMPEPAGRYGQTLVWHWRDVAGLRVGERALGRPQATDG